MTILHDKDSLFEMTAPTPELWGGLLQSVAELSTDTKECFETDPTFQKLKHLEETTTAREVLFHLYNFGQEEIDRLNSPLLDLLYRICPDHSIQFDDESRDRALAKANTAQLRFVLDRKLMDANTILQTVCFYGNKDSAAYLLDQGADIHAAEDRALGWACTAGHKEVVALLLDHGADIHVGNDWASRRAAENGHTEVVALLLDRGADLHARDDYALCWAARAGHKDVVTLLLDRGANLHALEDHPLRGAAANGHKDVVELLLDRGANMHAAGDGALRAASFHRQQDVVQLMLNRGANPNVLK